MKRFRMSDADVSDCIREERRFNEYLRKRRSERIGRGEAYGEIAEYDRLIFASDRRLIALYAKNRRCGNIDDFTR